MKKNRELGFTLLELIIVIVIIGALAALISGNFITSLKKGRDARRKGDLQQIQKALEMYYEDNRVYPLSITSGSELAYNGKTYMTKVPSDPSNGCIYQYDSTDGTYYKLYSYIENTEDRWQGVNQSGYGLSCGCGNCKFGITSSNISL